MRREKPPGGALIGRWRRPDSRVSRRIEISVNGTTVYELACKVGERTFVHQYMARPVDSRRMIAERLRATRAQFRDYIERVCAPAELYVENERRNERRTYRPGIQVTFDGIPVGHIDRWPG